MTRFRDSWRVASELRRVGRSGSLHAAEAAALAEPFDEIEADFHAIAHGAASAEVMPPAKEWLREWQTRAESRLKSVGWAKNDRKRP